MTQPEAHGLAAKAPATWRTDATVAVAIAAAMFCFHVAALGRNLNDKAVHRAMAYMCVEGGSAAADAVTAEALAIWPTGDPLDRLSYCTSYWLPNRLTLEFEHLPLYSAFQSVFAAHFVLHVFCLGVVLVLARALLGRSARMVALGLLLSFAPWFFVADWVFPFANSFFGSHSWRVGYPRGSAILLACFAGLLLHLQTPVGEPRTRALFGAALAVTLALLMHWQMAVMYALIAGCGAALPRLESREDLGRTTRRALLAAGVIVVLKTAAIVAHLHVVRGVEWSNIWMGSSRVFAIAAGGFAVLYFGATRWLIGLWLDVRGNASLELLALGDAVVRVLVPFAFLCLALYPLEPHSHEWADSVVIAIYEPSRRVLGGAHLAWFWLATIVATVRWPHFVEDRRWAQALALACAASGAAVAYDAFGDSAGYAEVRDASLLHVEIEDVREVSPVSEDAFRVYHAIANEMRQLLWPDATTLR